MRRPLVKVRKPKQGRGYEQGAHPAKPPLQKILHPATKEKFFRYGNKEKSEDPRE